MAKTSRSASKDVKGAMRKRKRGTLKSGSGRKVKSRKQAIAIGLSEARRKGKRVAPQEEIKLRHSLSGTCRPPPRLRGRVLRETSWP
jgi:hypothetical protein